VLESRRIYRVDLQRNVAFLSRIADPAIVVLPCHDPGIFTSYPAVTPNIVRIFGLSHSRKTALFRCGPWAALARMKSVLPFILAISLVVAAPFGAYGKKGKGNKEENATPAPADPSNPVAALSPYIINLDGLLALQRQAKSTQQFAAGAPGKLLVLRQEFNVEMEKAPENLKKMYAAAIKTCDLITAALEDRGKIAGDLSASQAVNSDGKLQDPAKKDNLTQGIHGGGLAKAVGSVVERDREKQAIARGQAQNAANGNALTAMSANQWNQRATAWHNQIAAAYSEIK
jgi:hypothetical protein